MIDQLQMQKLEKLRHFLNNNKKNIFINRKE